MCWCDVLFDDNCGSRCLPVRRGASTPSSRSPDILGIAVNGRKRREGGGTLPQNQRLRAQELVLLGAPTFCTRISPALNRVEASITAVCHYGIVDHGKQLKCFRSSQPSSQNLPSRPSALLLHLNTTTLYLFVQLKRLHQRAPASVGTS